jgi:DHA1 family bicyclomycin/chloramphenicol resistance-like MFS transporter
MSENTGLTRIAVPLAAMQTALMPFAMDMYLPALPEMTQDFATSASMLQWTISAFLLGAVGGPLLAGPLSDSHGRRVWLIGVSVAFTMICLLCSQVRTVEELLLLRVLQSLASGAAFSIARAMLSDLMTGDRLARALSLTMMVMTTAPLIAPTLGGEILTLFGWRSIFIALAVIGSITAIATWLFLPETLAMENRQPFKARTVLRTYAEMLNHARALGLGSIAGFLAAAYFANLAATPFIIIDYHGGSSRLFALFFASAGAMAILANMINAHFVIKIGYANMLAIALGMAMIDTAILFYVTLTDFGGVWGVIACVVWLMGLFQTISSNAMAAFLSLYRTRSGAASAVFTAFRFGFGIAGSAIAGAIYGGQPWTFGLIAFGSICAASIVAAFTLKGEIRPA